MEDVLGVYQRPYDPACHVLCLHGASKELHDTPHGSMPLQHEQPVCQDYEYKRHSVANLFLAVEPLRGWRKVRVTDRRTKRDFAEQLCLLAYEDYPHVLDTSQDNGSEEIISSNKNGKIALITIIV